MGGADEAMNADTVLAAADLRNCVIGNRSNPSEQRAETDLV
jgi:hypothetical protein